MNNKSLNIIKFLSIAVVGVFVLAIYFSNRTYTVTYDTKGGTIYKSVELKKNETVPKPEDPVLEGYTFVGWFLDDSPYDFSTPVTKSITITAKWQ